MNHLLLWKDITLFWGRNPRATSNHKHPVIQWVIGIHEPFLSFENGKWISKKGLLIAPNHPHQCDARNQEILTLTIDPESSFGEWVSHTYLHTQAVVDFKSKMGTQDIKHQIDQENWTELRLMLERIFEYQKGNQTPSSRDERINQVLHYISAHIESRIETKTLMEVAHLSESRLLHLFKAEMGLPIRNYLLWYRLKTAFNYMVAGHNLTEAAHLAGFADQAHMTRTCVKMVGVPPSLLAKNSKYVQVSIVQEPDL